MCVALQMTLVVFVVQTCKTENLSTLVRNFAQTATFKDSHDAQGGLLSNYIRRDELKFYRLLNGAFDVWSMFHRKGNLQPILTSAKSNNPQFIHHRWSFLVVEDEKVYVDNSCDQHIIVVNPDSDDGEGPSIHGIRNLYHLEVTVDENGEYGLDSGDQPCFCESCARNLFRTREEKEKCLCLSFRESCVVNKKNNKGTKKKKQATFLSDGRLFC